MNPNDTQSIKISPPVMQKALVTLLGLIGTIVMWFASSALGKLDAVANSVADLKLVTERRVTLLEESQRSQDAQIRTMQELVLADRKRQSQ